MNEEYPYLRKHRETYILYDCLGKDFSMLYFVDENGQVKNIAKLSVEDTVTAFYAASQRSPEDHKLIVGERFFILGLKGNELVISIYNISD